jgi:hypothetical protein
MTKKKKKKKKKPKVTLVTRTAQQQHSFFILFFCHGTSVGAGSPKDKMIHYTDLQLCLLPKPTPIN